MSEIPERYRLRLVLGKFRVTSVSSGLTGTQLKINLDGAVTMVVDAPIQADVKLGDILTLYTEVLSKEIPNAPPLPASK